MNSKQQPIPANKGNQDRSTSLIQQLKNLVRNNLVITITVTAAGSLLLTGASTWNIWSIYNSFQSVVVKGVELQKISSDLLYQDEALTMSARMSASTGETQWSTRYKKFAAENDATLKKFLSSISIELRTEASKTNTASDKLLAMEDKSFKLVEQAKQKEASAILNGAEYAAQKKIYGDGSNLVLTKVDRSIQTELDNYQQQLIASLVFAGGTLPILLASWTLVLSAVRDYIRDRQAAAAMAVSRTELIQANDRIVSAVVDTAQQVTTDAGQLAQAAIETTHQAQSQAIEVRSVQLLMDNINALTADSRQQAIETAIAVQQAKSAVVSGKAAIESTTDGIETLQQGTVQIIKRSELLTEFVDLAAQFSKDQKRVAALTRVLALNVSTLSSRAIQERDPEQFASLAKEFEAIALQVNTLATDTNYSLASLQQRTDRVQTVTSGLTQDISDIDRLVQKFTTEVDKSRQAFDNIETVTEQVAQMSEKVNSSSQDIVRVVSDTLSVIQSISSIAQSTEAKASITRQQVESMGTLANKLLQMVEFFNLNESTSPRQITAIDLPSPKQLAQA